MYCRRSRRTVNRSELGHMDFDLSESEKTFRDEVRAWLKANVPRKSAPEEGQKGFIESRRAWQKKLYDAGSIGITWPKEHGRRGHGFIEQLVLKNQMIQAKAPEPDNTAGLAKCGSAVKSHRT